MGDTGISLDLPGWKQRCVGRCFLLTGCSPCYNVPTSFPPNMLSVRDLPPFNFPTTLFPYISDAFEEQQPMRMQIVAQARLKYACHPHLFYPCFSAIKVGDGGHNAITRQVTWLYASHRSRCVHCPPKWQRF
jgi:hypothetical protein